MCATRAPRPDSDERSAVPFLSLSIAAISPLARPLSSGSFSREDPGRGLIKASFARGSDRFGRGDACKRAGDRV